MAEEEVKRLERPELPPPVQGSGEIGVIIIGKPKITSDTLNVAIERKA